MKNGAKVLLGLWMLSIAALPGCGFKDIDRRFFVMAIGIDGSGIEDKPFRVSLKLAIPFPKIQPGQTNAYRLVSDDASTITEAVRHIKSKVDKELDFSQSKMIVVGKAISGKILEKDMLDWFLRRRDIQSCSYMALGDPSAEAVLNVKTSSERFPGDSLFLSFDRDGTESSYIATESLFDFHRRVREKGIDPYLPLIRTIDDSAFLIDQVAVFDKERMKAILTSEETRIFNELVARIQSFDIETKTEQVQFALSVHRFRYAYDIRDAPPAINLKGRIVAQAEESTEAFYTRPWTYYEQLAERQAETRYARLLQKLQRLNVDPVGFGLRYRATRYGKEKDWKAWQALYPKVAFHPKVSIDIKSSGGIK
ncbi:Spore germination B3/ GerAC like, C-terminal [Paenibacillus sp. UNC496MF]|uniref:Ger(x)C family spore germination protein n=1 Tax=Paenibacillus sp. UNC496MF TaxID=1502753 RepID=UPI0008E37CBD|nr:Ger(x)C family spore germination protein [Paenibacillus sp. UNC496MF]SFI37126.1 Spore germination B3/ GerAC like, C-terminal [Paenibacillus sp. UNC496MF]